MHTSHRERIIVVGRWENVSYRWIATYNDSAGVYEFDIEQEVPPNNVEEVVLVPQTQQTQPEEFRVIVNDTQSWNDEPPLFRDPPAMPTFPTLARMIASDSEDEDTAPTIPYVPSSPNYIPVSPVPQKRKRGRPRGSRNKRRSTSRPPTQSTSRPPPQSALPPPPLEDEEEENECSCCLMDNQMTIKCRTDACDRYMCIACLKVLDQRFDGNCPWCRQRF